MEVIYKLNQYSFYLQVKGKTVDEVLNFYRPVGDSYLSLRNFKALILHALLGVVIRGYICSFKVDFDLKLTISIDVGFKFNLVVKLFFVRLGNCEPLISIILDAVIASNCF